MCFLLSSQLAAPPGVEVNHNLEGKPCTYIYTPYILNILSRININLPPARALAKRCTWYVWSVGMLRSLMKPVRRSVHLRKALASDAKSWCSRMRSPCQSLQGTALSITPARNASAPCVCRTKTRLHMPSRQACENELRAHFNDFRTLKACFFFFLFPSYVQRNPKDYYGGP